MNEHPGQGELVQLLYGDGDPKLIAQVRAHVDDCDLCQSQLEQWGGVCSQLDLDSPVERKAKEQGTNRHSWLAIAIAASLLIGFLGGAYWKDRSFEQRMAALETSSRNFAKVHQSEDLGKHIQTTVARVENLESSFEDQNKQFQKDLVASVDWILAEQKGRADQSNLRQQNSLKRLVAALILLNRRQTELEQGINQVAHTADQAIGYLDEQLNEMKRESFVGSN